MKFTEILDTLNIPYKSSGHEHCRPGWLQLDCPWCAKPGHYRLGYNLSKGYFHCWACGAVRLQPTLCEISEKSIKEILNLTNGIILDRVPEKLKVSGTLKMPLGVEDELRKGHKEYLKRRGFDWERIQRIWGIKGLGPYAKELSWRIWIPIYYRGEIVSWTTRSIRDDHKLRYRSAKKEQEKIDHKHLLYGEDFATDSVTIHEGPLDVWKVGPGAVGTFGTGYTRQQLVKMSKFSKRAVCFDNESAGQKAAAKLASELSLFDGDTYNVCLNAKDAGSASSKEIRKLRRAFL